MNPVIRKPRPKRIRNRWGNVRQFDVPKWLIRDGLVANDGPFRCLVALFYAESEQPKRSRIGQPATVFVSRDRLCTLTGLSPATVSKAIRLLRGYILQDLGIRKLKGVDAGFGTARYTLLSRDFDFETGEFVPLVVNKDQRLLPGNRCEYVTVPRLVLSDTLAQYSLAKMRPSESTVYFTCLSVATRTNAFTMQTSDLLRLTDLTLPTIQKAFYALRSRGLIKGTILSPATNDSAGETAIELFDPATGQPIPAPMAEPEPEPDDYPRTNLARPDVERLLRERIPKRRYTVTSTGNMNINCPYHNDPTPSLSVNLNEGGVWFCHECKRAGPFVDLLAKLDDVPRTQVASDLKDLVKVTPDKPEWTREDYRAAKLYPYKTLDGELIRWKARNPRYKDFKWFHSVNDKAIPGKGSAPPSLYHQELLAKADTVVIVEGERDGDTVTELLWKHGHPVIGVTSGSSTSWKPGFAKLLRGKRVVVMPDDTMDGWGYAKDVTDSLSAEGIPHTVVSFRAEGCKDVSDYMLTQTADDLLRRIDGSN